jgi:hypothetical protein
LGFAGGTDAAIPLDMAGARRFEDLVAWQRMRELNLEIWKGTDRIKGVRTRNENPAE